MDKRALLLGMAVWLTLLGLGILWATNPLAKPPSSNLPKITPEETARAYRIRLASLPASKPSMVSHVREAEHALEAGEARARPVFDYEEWAFRELRARFVLFFLVWVASGFLFHWLAKRAFRPGESAR